MNKYKASFLILIFFLPFLIYSKELHIKVIDKDLLMPLEGAAIKVQHIEEEIITDSNGKAIIYLHEKIERVLITCSLIILI